MLVTVTVRSGEQLKGENTIFFYYTAQRFQGYSTKFYTDWLPAAPKVQPPYPFVTSYHFHVVANKWNDTAMTEYIG